MFKFLPVTILTQAVFLAMCAGIYLMPWSVFILPGVFLFAFSFPMEKILRRLMPPVDEDSEEAQKWFNYYERIKDDFTCRKECSLAGKARRA